MQRIAIFASGNGSNAERIATCFQSDPDARVVVILTNNPSAGVLARAERLGIPAVVFDRNGFTPDGTVGQTLREYQTDFIVLAGFLWLVPSWLLNRWPGKVVNIHPALLPLYGGKGMYGDRVHEAVLAAGDNESGITIHLVNEHYDEGNILFQARCPVFPGDTTSSLAARIHELEHRYFPEVIGNMIRSSQ